MNKTPFLQIDAKDNLIVALQNIKQGTHVQVGSSRITILEDIPAKHKFTLADLTIGEKAIMYGVVVGETTKNVQAGALITTSNLRHATSAYENNRAPFSWTPPAPYHSTPQEFMGIRRPDGKIGTANYWVVVPLVFCSDQELSTLKAALTRALGYNRSSRYESYAEKLAGQIRETGKISKTELNLEAAHCCTPPLLANIDGISFLHHSLGCGNTPGDIDSLIATLANYITHPNVAGATVISLGCQMAELSRLKDEIAKRDPESFKPVLYYERQKWAGPGDMLDDIIRRTMESMIEANTIRREPVPLSELTIGVECGASDGFSGISANPVIGRSVDHLVAHGGTGILSEFPELCGVEHELVSRCVTREAAERYLHLSSTYRKQVQAVGSDFDLNPSPGNIRDGLITDAIKSAGAAKKGGSSPIVNVHDYGEQVSEKGLNLLCTPGSDVESVTALVGAGANLILFSTGLGTPTGNPIVPVIKVSTNSEMAQRLEYMIDFNTGPVITGEQSLDEMAEKLLLLSIQTASGTYTTKASRLGQEDFIPWKRGVSL